MKLPAITPLDNVFTDRETWTLFRWTAWAETVGWTLLLIGILFQVMHWPGDSWLLPIGGSIHGMIVVAYMGAVFAVHRSFRHKWSTGKMLFAEVINAIPYAVIIFEQYEYRSQRQTSKATLVAETK